MHRADFSFIRCHSVFRGLTRRSSATAGGSELCFHFILHNSSFSLSVRRPAVSWSNWLDRLATIPSCANRRSAFTMINNTPMSGYFLQVEHHDLVLSVSGDCVHLVRTFAA